MGFDLGYIKVKVWSTFFTLCKPRWMPQNKDHAYNKIIQNIVTELR